MAVIALCATVACTQRTSIEKVPIGAVVQITRQDGGVVDGKLSARNEKTVTVKASGTTRTVARGEIADVQVVTTDNPAELPSVAAFREYSVPDGTELRLSLETSASSDTSTAGDPVEARLTEAVRVGDVEVLPAGSVVRGTVTAARSAGKVNGRASLALHFDTVEVGDARYAMSAGIAVEAASTKKKDAATIGIPAAAGAIIGAIVGGGKGAAAGAAIGGGGGTAVVLLTGGKPIAFGHGMNMKLTLAKAIDVRVPVL